MLSINTNLLSLQVQSGLNKSTNLLNQAIERMTSGYKINSAKDNAANYSISTNMTTKISAYKVAEENALMGLDMISTASDALESIDNKLARLKALAEQAANGTYGADSLKAINSEANALVDEINRIYATAEYNGEKFFVKDVDAAASIAAFSARATGGRKFINDVTERDTSTMTALPSASSVSGSLASGTYAINSKADLIQLADITNSGKLSDSNSYEFVLGCDIDLSGMDWTPIGGAYDGGDEPIFFHGTFDGNGHTISNLTILNRKVTTEEVGNGTSDPQNYNVGLFGAINNATIKNLAVEDANINSGVNAGIIVGAADYTSTGTGSVSTNYVINCFTSGSVQHSDTYDSISCATGVAAMANIESTYSTAKVTGVGYVVAGMWGCNVKNSFFAGQTKMYGPIMPEEASVAIGSENNYENCYFADDFSTPETLAYYESYIASKGITGLTKMSKEEIFALFNLNPEASGGNSGGVDALTSSIKNLQVGIYGDKNSSISVDFAIPMLDVEELRNIGNNQSADYLEKIDKIMSTVSAKQTDIGAVQNRLESAIEQISIQYENLVSSRSTIRDVDIAKVSSQYIQQQILQQASATLLSTANQTPALALSLLQGV